jgi:hypothetical protein
MKWSEWLDEEGGGEGFVAYLQNPTMIPSFLCRKEVGESASGRASVYGFFEKDAD